jgi:hypothetical protein
MLAIISTTQLVRPIERAGIVVPPIVSFQTLELATAGKHAA